MAERTFIPSSPACGQWETLLAEALDGLLKPDDEATFSAHMAACPACSALFEEARRGREWLEFLSPEPEVPAGLLDRILAQTGPGHPVDSRLAMVDGHGMQMSPAWQRPGFMGYIRRFAEPRLMMTAAMAFFSIAMTLNLTGVHLKDLRLSNLRPTAVRAFMERRLTMASTPIIRYYDHMRLVWEVQSTMRELRNSSQGEGQGDDEPNHGKQQENTPGESKQTPGQPPAHKEGGSRVDPPQQSISPTLNDSDFFESRLTDQQEPAHSGGTRTEMRERSTVWTA
jgi:hypothetical protein